MVQFCRLTGPMLHKWPKVCLVFPGPERARLPASSPRLPGRRHRNPTAGQDDRVRYRLARRVVCGVPTQLRPRLHSQRPGRSTGFGADQDHCKI